MPSNNLQMIHIPKNGGTSLRSKTTLAFDAYTKTVPGKVALRLDAADASVQLQKHYLTRPLGHVRYRDYHPEWIAERKTFAIIRNPWSREVSKYRFIFTSIQQGAKDNRGMLNKRFAKENGHTMTFEEYLFDVADAYMNLPYMWLHACESFYSQKSYVVNDDNQVSCDILRFENYREDIDKYLGKRKVGHKNKQELGDYREYYNEKLIQRVADLYLEDIVHWGYDFDTGATKNYWNEE